MTTLLVAGPRDWGRTLEEEVALWTALEKFAERYGLHEIVHGNAKGADTIASEFALNRPEVMVTRFPADWERYGRAAGPRRNRKMAEYIVGLATEHGVACAHAMVCHRNGSWTPGTSSMYSLLRDEAAVVPILVTHVTSSRTTEEALP